MYTSLLFLLPLGVSLIWRDNVPKMNAQSDASLRSESRKHHNVLLRWVIAGCCTVALIFPTVAADVLDLDNDGMSDVWQRVHGIATGDTASDPDQDGHDNAQEARAGTNPHSLASRLQTITFTLNTTATTATLTWKSENGKNYDIEYSADLMTWTHSSYVTGNGSNKTATITLAAAAKKFYRIRARQTEDDSDDDTLTNWEENLLGTNKNSTDSDGDGMHDDWEFIHSLNNFADDAYADSDGDGIPNIGEFYYNFNPQSADSDGDSIADNIEFPWNADLDNDGLTNQQEIITHQTRADMDDTDADGLVDGWEITNTLNAKDSMGPNGGVGDPDGDGLSNRDEQAYGTNPKNGDTDGDGTSDLTEITQGSNPKDPSDGGNPPATPPQQLVVTWGDPSTSHSEKYKVTITSPDDPEAPYFWSNKSYGEVSTHTFKKFKVGKKYNIELSWIASDPDYRGKPKPDFDYTFGIASAPCLLIDDPTAAPPTNHPVLGSHSNDESPHQDGSFWASGKKVIVCFPKFTWVTPKDSPVTAPDDTLPGQNEFTFNGASPGVLDLEFEVKVEPSGIAQKLIDKGMVKFSEPTPTITGSTYAWAPANATPPGQPTAVGDNLKANATYTTLPATNDQFGAKKARFACDGMNIPEADFEVFFPKTQTNHPGLNAGTDPNWFFYWKEGGVCSIPGTAIYDGSRNLYGYVRPGTDMILRIGSLAPETNTGPETFTGVAPYGSVTVTGTGKGIKCVAETVTHEVHHLTLFTTLAGRPDADGDGIADADEGTLDGINSNPASGDTYGLGTAFGDPPGTGYHLYGDNELRCRKKELSPDPYDPMKDWANPGCQSKNKFGP